MRPVFPFTAVVGQQPVKTALLLSLADPLIGGVLVSGSRGSAKSTLVRSVQSMVSGGTLVTLPLGATDEMLTGSIDLQQALQSSEVSFRPGLLARAHEGILYVDEVNLLPDHLVDLLLDVSASGINHVERDGISHEHAARFVLIGSMNPDEGELRPQLLDRFGLLAPVQTTFSVAERRQIVAERLAFDEAAHDLIDRHTPALEELTERVRLARSRLASVIVPESIGEAIAGRCQEAGVEGLRADIILYRACRAHAALDGRSLASEVDLEVVAELVLAHRRRDAQPPGPDSRGRTDAARPPAGSADAGSRGSGGESLRTGEAATRSAPGESAETREDDRATGSGSSGTSSSSKSRPVDNTDNQAPGGSSIRGAWGAMSAVPVDSAPPTAIDVIDRSAGKSPCAQPIAGSNLPPETGRSKSFPGGRMPSGRPSAARVQESRINWFRTLADSDNLARRRQGRGPTKLHRREHRQRRLLLDIVLLDSSGSTLVGQGLSRAKGVIRYLSRQAYLGRRHLSLIVFGNEQVHCLLTPRRAPKHIEALLEPVSGGGGTPLSDALQVVNRLLHGMRHRPVDSCLYLLTDGRVRDVAALPACHANTTTLIDIESSGVRLGRGVWLAESLGARYVRIGRPVDQP